MCHPLGKPILTAEDAKAPKDSLPAIDTADHAHAAHQDQDANASIESNAAPSGTDNLRDKEIPGAKEEEGGQDSKQIRDSDLDQSTREAIRETKAEAEAKDKTKTKETGRDAENQRRREGNVPKLEEERKRAPAQKEAKEAVPKPQQEGLSMKGKLKVKSALAQELSKRLKVLNTLFALALGIYLGSLCFV